MSLEKVTEKETTTDIIYRIFLEEIKSKHYRLTSFDAWVITWHLSQESGYPTAQINYHLNKLVKAGKLLKKTSVYCTQFRLRFYEGWIFKNDKFELVPDMVDGKTISRVNKCYKVGSDDWKAQLDMLLPDGVSCADCSHEQRCNKIFGGNSENTDCQFYPSRFNFK